MRIRFQWDPQKATRNATKHGVTFLEAATVFQDPLAFIFDDEEHSDEEHREIIIDHSKRRRLLVVSFPERDDVIRVIGALSWPKILIRQAARGHDDLSCDCQW